MTSAHDFLKHPKNAGAYDSVNNVWVIKFSFEDAGSIPATANATGFQTRSWNEVEKQSVLNVLSLFESVANIKFELVNDPDLVNIGFAKADLSVPDYKGFADFPDGSSKQYVRFDDEAMPSWSSNAEMTAGSEAFWVMLHETAHALGLKHSHDTEAGVGPLPGITNETPYGDFDLNQMGYTMMSYHDGFKGIAPTAFSAGPMALDITALQDKYGAPLRPEIVQQTSGDNTYIFGSSPNTLTTIYDTGGHDTIQYNGSNRAVIDLRAADASGANEGGYVSFIEGQNTALTIAHGTIIERAIGGSGSDIFIPNWVTNFFDGGDNGSMRDTTGVRTSYGDTVIYSNLNLAKGIKIKFGISADVNEYLDIFVHKGLFGYDNFNNYGEVYDTLRRIETVFGTDHADTLTLDSRTLGILNSINGFDYLIDLAGGQNVVDAKDVEASFLKEIKFDKNTATLIHENGSITVHGVKEFHSGNGNETVTMGYFDYFNGGGGSDTVIASARAERMSGGTNSSSTYMYARNVTGDDIWQEESDTISYELSTAGVRVNLQTNTASGGFAEGDVISEFENVIGSDYDDVLTGDDGNNKLYGGKGNDILFGGEGDDYLDGGDGDDLIYANGNGVIDGGSGRDTIDGSKLSHDLLISLDYGFGQSKSQAGKDISFTVKNIENIVGTRFNDILVGNKETNIIHGGAGDDVIDDGGGGNDELYGGSGNDTIAIWSTSDRTAIVDGGAGNDIIQLRDKLVSPVLIDGGSGYDTVEMSGTWEDWIFKEITNNTETKLVGRHKDNTTWTEFKNIEDFVFYDNFDVHFTKNQLFADKVLSITAGFADMYENPTAELYDGRLVTKNFLDTYGTPAYLPRGAISVTLNPKSSLTVTSIDIIGNDGYHGLYLNGDNNSYALVFNGNTNRIADYEKYISQMNNAYSYLVSKGLSGSYTFREWLDSGADGYFNRGHDEALSFVSNEFKMNAKITLSNGEIFQKTFITPVLNWSGNNTPIYGSDGIKYFIGENENNSFFDRHNDSSVTHYYGGGGSNYYRPLSGQSHIFTGKDADTIRFGEASGDVIVYGFNPFEDKVWVDRYLTENNYDISHGYYDGQYSTTLMDTYSGGSITLVGINFDTLGGHSFLSTYPYW